MRTILAVVLGLSVAQTSGVAFRIAEPDLIPEGIAYDSQTKQFFVGSTFKRKIVAIDAKGKVRDFTKEGQDGAFGFVGMRVDARRRALWAITSHAGQGMPGRGLTGTCLGCSTVHVYNIDTGRLMKKHELPNKDAQHFLNDLVLLPNGDAVISDTMTGYLYRITPAKNALERWINLGAQVFPNGIDAATDGRTLFVATEAGVRKVDAATGAARPISGNIGSIDGLYFHKNALVLILPFEEGRKVMRYPLGAGHESLGAGQVLDGGGPHFQQPTTGVIVGDDFYFIANAQLQLFRGMYQDGKYDRSRLRDVVILKRRLN